jgi:rhodanese-related sulfurtransferase
LLVMTVPEIDVHELARRREAGAVLLDVRNPGEWEEARVPGVPLIPLGELPERAEEVPAGEPLHVICAVGARSAKAAEFLRARGVDAVNVAGGTKGWIEAGYPTESGPG